MISIIIPAYNEEKYLGATLEAIFASATGDGRLETVVRFEVIVVDNESTDATSEIASRLGAKVVGEAEHNISRVRNTGAAAASGEILVFIDADTTVERRIFERIDKALANERCFGGSVAVEYEATYKRRWIRYYLMGWQFWGRVLGMRQGALQFCRRAAFRELDGYDKTIFMGEDIEFHWRLERLARKSGGFVTFIEEPKVRTSSRRYERMGLFRTLFLTHPITILLAWRTRRLWKDWYENAVR